jgi:hypothetical protein
MIKKDGCAGLLNGAYDQINCFIDFFQHIISWAAWFRKQNPITEMRRRMPYQDIYNDVLHGESTFF